MPTPPCSHARPRPCALRPPPSTPPHPPPAPHPPHPATLRTTWPPSTSCPPASVASVLPKQGCRRYPAPPSYPPAPSTRTLPPHAAVAAYLGVPALAGLTPPAHASPTPSYLAAPQLPPNPARGTPPAHLGGAPPRGAHAEAGAAGVTGTQSSLGGRPGAGGKGGLTEGQVGWAVQGYARLAVSCLGDHFPLVTPCVGYERVGLIHPKAPAAVPGPAWCTAVSCSTTSL